MKHLYKHPYAAAPDHALWRRAFAGKAASWVRRLFDVVAYTINLLFLAAFAYAISFKVYDIYLAGEISSEILMPLWIGYTFASIGIVAAVIMAALRWWQVMVMPQPATSSHV